MRSISLGLLLATAAALLPTLASADEQSQSSFTALIGKGFEVKSVTLVPLDVAKRMMEKVRTDNVIVTLQKQDTVAVCYIAFVNWALMTKTSLASSTLCEVRSSAMEESAAQPAPPAPEAEAPHVAAPPPAQQPEPEPPAPAPQNPAPAAGSNP